MDKQNNDNKFEEEMSYLIRERLQRFNEQIYKTLMRNVREKCKGRWDNVPKILLIDKLNEEYKELIDAIKSGKPEYITLESTDLAAVCMFIFDNFGSKEL